MKAVLASLKYRIAITIFVLEAVMMAFVLSQTLDHIRDNTQKHIGETERVIFDLLAGLSRTALFTVEFGELQSYVEQVSQDPNIRQVLIANRNGRIIVSAQFSDVGQTMPKSFDDTEILYWRQRSLGELGQIAIQFSKSPQIETRREAIRVGIITALAGMTFIAIAGIGLGYLLTRRLSRLGDTAQQIAEGHFDARVGLHGDDEVSFLGRTFDRMAERIRDNIAELETRQRELTAARDELEDRVRERTAALEAANEQLRELSEIDPLTRVANRRRFDATIEKEVRRAHRNSHPLALIMIDVDFFKRFNDNYGHLAGDRCLTLVAGALMRAAARRPGDLVARYGGEEFVVLLPETTLEGAILVAENICNEIRKMEIPHDHSDAAPFVTASLGLTCYLNTAETLQPAQLIVAADDALYQAKESGRNRAVARPLENRC